MLHLSECLLNRSVSVTQKIASMCIRTRGRSLWNTARKAVSLNRCKQCNSASLTAKLSIMILSLQTRFEFMKLQIRSRQIQNRCVQITTEPNKHYINLRMPFTFESLPSKCTGMHMLNFIIDNMFIIIDWMIGGGQTSHRASFMRLQNSVSNRQLGCFLMHKVLSIQI